jgi:glycosyltransferase involved in cell wall biosynthesis
MSVGLPIVATDVGGLSECVDHGRNGLLVPAKSPRALAAAIISLMRDPEKRQKLGEMASATVDERFSPEPQTRKVLLVFQQAISGQGPGAGGQALRGNYFLGWATNNKRNLPKNGRKTAA